MTFALFVCVIVIEWTNKVCCVSLPLVLKCCYLVLLNQVLESDLRKKMFHAQEAFNQAKHTLTYFNFQKQRLEDLMSQMAERLEGVEGSISDLTEASSLERIQTVKV